MKEKPREEIEKLIQKGDLEALLGKAAELHGHFCSYLAYGVKAGYRGQRNRIKKCWHGGNCSHS
jgi:formylmethanofuran dehydrogenase subunit E